jgi:putative peptidoglycan lipid II flippase
MSNNLVKSSMAFSVMTFLSRILGFIRDMVAAAVFGASPGYDAFVLSFRIPNLMRRLFAEGAFSQAFVPVLSEYQTQKSPDEVKTFVNHICGNLAMILAIVTIIGMIAAPLFIYLFAPGFDPNGPRHELATAMLRLTFPYIFFISLTAMCGGLLNTYGKFAVPAFTPVLLNISMIMASCFLAPYMQQPEMALAWGVLLAGILQLAFQVPFLLKMGIMPRPNINWRDPAVRRVLILMPPAIFGAAISQITLLVDSLFASFLVSGSISWLYYADRLMEFPLGIIGVGLATVILPSLSRHYSKGAQHEFDTTLDWGVRCTIIIGIPAMLGLFVLAGPLVATLFKSGKFTDHDVLMTQQCLMAYALAVIGIMLAKIFSSAFYATRNIKTPVKISVFILGVNVLLNALLITKFAHVGLAMATSLTSLINAALLYNKWRRMHKFKFQPGWNIFLARVFLASTLLTVFLWLLTPGVDTWIEWPRMQRVVNLVPLIAGGAAIYGLALLALGVRPRHFVTKSEMA